MEILRADKVHHNELIAIWEVSVRATHHFLVEEDIVFFKSLVGRYLGAVDLYLVRDDGKIAGFLGTGDNEVQMLFLHPRARGKGIGKFLMRFAIDNCQATKVEVNEQNQQAVGFYEHLGFKITGRSETDYFGKPYPILSMQLSAE